MRLRSVSILASLVLLTSLVAQDYRPALAAQTQSGTNPTPDRVIGEVRAIDLANKKITIRADAGNPITVTLADSTTYLKVPVGEKSLERAQKITATDIQAGDRMFARGDVSQDQKSIAARQVVIMAKADIAQKQEREREEWTKRGISGVVSALNPETREITLEVRTADGSRPIILAERQGIRFRRYAPGSVKFADAKPSSFTELKVGDQVRALGDKSADGKRFSAEEVVTGSFRTVGGTVLEVIPQRREVKIAQLSNKQELTIVITRETMIRRITPQLANFIVTGSESGEAAKSSDAKRPKGPADLQALLEKTPPMPPQEIRPGDVVIVSSTQGADPNRVTAIAYLTGLDVLLSVLQGKKPPADSTGLRNVDTGLPVGVLEFGIGLP
jgi:hypothetical protein